MKKSGFFVKGKVKKRVWGRESEALLLAMCLYLIWTVQNVIDS